MVFIKSGIALLMSLALWSGNTAFAVEFHECAKFVEKEPQKHRECIENSFSDAVSLGKHQQAIQWLGENKNEEKRVYSELLTILMCGHPRTQGYGKRQFKTQDRENIIKLTDELLERGASFEAMPHFSIVTPLFCVSNRKDSVVLDHVLTRIKADEKALDQPHYEGTDPAYVPLIRAAMNGDIESAKVLLKHDASVNYKVYGNETALLKAVQTSNLDIANLLLDEGASVHQRGSGFDCTEKSVLGHALEIAPELEGRDELVSRIQALLLEPSKHEDVCP